MRQSIFHTICVLVAVIYGIVVGMNNCSSHKNFACFYENETWRVSLLYFVVKAAIRLATIYWLLSMLSMSKLIRSKVTFLRTHFVDANKLHRNFVLIAFGASSIHVGGHCVRIWYLDVTYTKFYEFYRNISGVALFFIFLVTLLNGATRSLFSANGSNWWKRMFRRYHRILFVWMAVLFTVHSWYFTPMIALLLIWGEGKILEAKNLQVLSVVGRGLRTVTVARGDLPNISGGYVYIKYKGLQAPYTASVNQQNELEFTLSGQSSIIKAGLAAGDTVCIYGPLHSNSHIVGTRDKIILFSGAGLSVYKAYQLDSNAIGIRLSSRGVSASRLTVRPYACAQLNWNQSSPADALAVAAKIDRYSGSHILVVCGATAKELFTAMSSALTIEHFIEFG